MTDDEEFRPELWTYAGRQAPDTGTRFSDVWVDQSGQRLRYGSVPGRSAIGSIYRVEVRRHGDNGVSARLRDREYVGRSADADAIVQWQIEDLLAAQIVAKRQLEASDRRRNDLDDALKPLLAIAAGLKGHAAREALVSYVTHKLWIAH